MASTPLFASPDWQAAFARCQASGPLPVNKVATILCEPGKKGGMNFNFVDRSGARYKSVLVAALVTSATPTGAPPTENFTIDEDTKQLEFSTPIPSMEFDPYGISDTRQPRSSLSIACIGTKALDGRPVYQPHMSSLERYIPQGFNRGSDRCSRSGMTNVRWHLITTRQREDGDVEVPPECSARVDAFFAHPLFAGVFDPAYWRHIAEQSEALRPGTMDYLMEATTTPDEAKSMEYTMKAYAVKILKGKFSVPRMQRPPLKLHALSSPNTPITGKCMVDMSKKCVGGYGFLGVFVLQLVHFKPLDQSLPSLTYTMTGFIDDTKLYRLAGAPVFGSSIADVATPALLTLGAKAMNALDDEPENDAGPALTLHDLQATDGDGDGEPPEKLQG